MNNKGFWKIILLLLPAFAVILLAMFLPYSAMQVQAQDAGADEDIVTLSTLDDWQAFATSVNRGNTYEGKTVVMTDDIEMTPAINMLGVSVVDNFMVGKSEGNSFRGTFNGCGHTLKVYYVLDKSSGNSSSPFRYIKNATIKNLIVTGTIRTYHENNAGIAAHTYGNCVIKNCISRFTLNNNYSGANSMHGGFVSVVEEGHLTVRDCLFDGTITYFSNYVKDCGGFIGLVRSGEELDMNNCLFNPNKLYVDTGETSTSQTFARTEEGAVCTLTGCYYTKTVVNVQQGAIEVGVSSDTETAEKLAAALGDRWEVTGSGSSAKAVPILINRNLSDSQIRGVESIYTYTGNEIPIICTVLADDLSVPEEGTDYTVSYKRDGRDAEFVLDLGEYEMTITAVEGNSNGYTGSQTVSFSVMDLPLIINSTEDWKEFTKTIRDITDYRGKTVTLTEDITVTTMAGDAEHKFSGTFDGGGHTLTVDYYVDEDYCAPFRYIDGASIKCLKIDGEIKTGNRYAAGLVSQSTGDSSIRNCISSVTINSGTNGGGYHGGFVGEVKSGGGKLSVTDCLFNGELLGGQTGNCGGFVGLTESGLDLESCLLDPLKLTLNNNRTNRNFAVYSPSFTPTFNKCYFTESIGFSDIQGIDTVQLGLDDAEGIVAGLGERWIVEDGKAVPVTDYRNLNAAAISNVNTSYPADGYTLHPEPVVTAINGKTLTAGSDYTVSYSHEDDSEPGKYSLTITGKEGSEFYGSRSVDYEVFNSGDKMIDGLGTGVIENPVVPAEGSTAPWTGSYVYYGEYDDKPVRYRALDKAATEFGGNTLLLDCDSLLYNESFYTAQNGLNGGAFLNKEGCFTGIERSAIVESNKSQKADSDGAGFNNLAFSPLKITKVFLLDVAEATRGSYGYGTDAGRIKSGVNTSVWWLRTPYLSSYGVRVLADGGFSSNYTNYSYGVSPAFNLSLSSILFSSPVPGDNDGEHKLTLLDDKIEIEVPSNSKVTRDGNKVIVPYAVKGNDNVNVNRISVLLLKDPYEAGKAVANGNGTGIPEYTYLPLETALTNDGTNGCGSFVLPAAYLNKVWGTDYHSYIVAEDVNGTYATDYASTPVKISIQHVHSLVYEAEGATITATCSEADCPFKDGKAALTINPPDSVYDGSLKAARFTGDITLLGTPSISYQEKTGSGSWSEPGASEPRNAGTYRARFTLGSGSGEAAATIEYDIQKRPVTITGLGAAGREYDGTTDVFLIGRAKLSGKVPGDDLNLIEGSASFEDAEPGQGKTVTFSGYSVSGTDIGNYSFSGQPASVTADIRKRAVTIKAADQSVKVNGSIKTGTEQVAVTEGSILTGHRLSGITLSDSGTDHATESGTVTPGNAVILDHSDNNVNRYYDITYVPGNLTVTNEPVYICGGITANSKTYDGTLSANITGEAVLKKVSDDTVVTGLSVRDIKAEFEDINAGSGKNVYIRSGSLSDPSDYTLIIGKTNETLKLNADISPKKAVLSWNSLNYEYDGTYKCPSAQVTDLVPGDICSVTVTGAQTDANEEGAAYTAEAAELSNNNYSLPEEWSERSVEFTIDKIEIKDTEIVKPRPISGLEYTGGYHMLVSAGVVTGKIGTIYYALTDEKASQAPPFDGKEDSEGRKWDTILPFAKDAGSYKVWWRVAGDGNHKDKDQVNPIEVSIDKVKYPNDHDQDDPVIEYVPYKQITESATLELPDLPDGASYTSIRQVSGDFQAFDVSVSGRIMTYSIPEYGQRGEAVLKIDVQNAVNYEDYEVYVKFITVPELVISGINDTYEYTGDEIVLNYSVSFDDGTEITDYDAVLSRNGFIVDTVREKGFYTLTVRSGEYELPKTVEFSVGKPPLSIGSEEDWNDFADWVNGGYDYSGRVVELTSDISVSRMAGGVYHVSEEKEIYYVFSGIFNGNGHKLTFSNHEDTGLVAPFVYISNAVVKNLTVAGTIRFNHSFPLALAGGIAAAVSGDCTIEHCISSITIDASSVTWDNYQDYGYIGGFVGEVAQDDGILRFEDCLFDGSIKSSVPFHCFGFVGYYRKRVDFVNCLFDPKEMIPPDEPDEHISVFVLDSYYSETDFLLDNSWYRWLPDGVEEQGNDGSGLTASELAEKLGRGWEVRDGSPVPIVDWNRHNLYISSVSMKTEYVSDGSPVHPVPVVKDLEGEILKQDEDFAVSYSDEDDSETGSYSLTVSGAEGSDYYGYRTLSYNVYAAKDKSVYCLGCVPGVNPGTDVNPGSVIFSSVIPDKAGEYKFTLSDNRLGIALPEGASAYIEGSTVTLPYVIGGDHARDVNRVSVLLLNEEYQPGKCVTNDSASGIPAYTYLLLDTELKIDGTEGTGTFELPEAYSGLECGKDYHVCLLAEEVSYPYMTDYASVPVSFTIAEKPGPEPPGPEPPGPEPPKPEPETEYHLLTGETRRLNLNPDGEYVYGVRWELYDVKPKGCVTMKNGIVTAKSLKKGFDHGSAKVKAVVYGSEDMVFDITVDDRVEGENGKLALPVSETISEGKKTYKLTAPKTVKSVAGAAKNKTVSIGIPANMRDESKVINVDILNPEVCDVVRDPKTGAPEPRYNKDDRTKASKATYEIVAKDAGAAWICWSMTDESKTENNTVTAWTKVTVTKPMDETLSVNEYSEVTPMELSVGGGERIKVYATMDNTDPKDLTFSVKGKGVKVSKSGYVSATVPGSEAEVTVKSGKIKKTIKVKVNEDHKDRYLTLNKITIAVKAHGDSSKKPAKLQLKLSTPKKKAEQPSVTWSIEEDPSEDSLKGIIDVDENGLVTVNYRAKPGCYRVKAEAKAENLSAGEASSDTSLNEAYCEVIVK